MRLNCIYLNIGRLDDTIILGKCRDTNTKCNLTHSFCDCSRRKIEFFILSEILSCDRDCCISSDSLTKIFSESFYKLTIDFLRIRTTCCFDSEGTIGDLSIRICRYVCSDAISVGSRIFYTYSYSYIIIDRDIFSQKWCEP